MNFTNIELSDVIDAPALQEMMDDYYALTGIGVGIIDLHGNVLVGTGWQDICVKFHRAHPESCQFCHESDVFLSSGVAPGTFKAYRCKNNMWDIASPIMLGDIHIGNIFTGQFLYADEVPDYGLFRAQARRFGFVEAEYIAALDSVPRWSHKTVNTAMSYYAKLAQMISKANYTNAVLKQTLHERMLAESALLSLKDRLQEQNEELQMNEEELRSQNDELLSTEEKLRVQIIKYEASQKQLEESKARYALTISAVNDGLWDWHVPSGKAVLSNIYYSMLGYKDGEFPANYDSWRALIHPDDIERVERQLQQGIESSKGFNIDLRMKTKSGDWLWVCTRGKTVEADTDGKALRLVGTLSDVSMRKNAEDEKYRLESQLQQAQKLESVGRLAGGVAHDFNNMLTVILGHAQLGMMRLEPTSRACADLQEISKTAERSAELTRQLLTFARKQSVAPKVLDLNENISGMLKMLQRIIGENLHLTWQPASDLWPIKVDPSQIDQILANLCANARDAIEDTGRITIETDNCTIDANYCTNHHEAVPGDYVRLSVSDDGAGMDKETLAHIFEPFYTTKELGKGTGLGLATVYGAVKQNNGFINIYSEPGQGTTFSIYLPRDGGSSGGQTMAEDTPAPVPRGQETILLVEDEPAILNIASQMLENQGYTVLKAETPGLAIHLAREHAGEIHLLMTDVIMPGMNGRDLAKNIISSHPQIKRMFMSGYTADVIAHHGVLDEGVQFIQKPFSLPNMAAMVRKTLDN